MTFQRRIVWAVVPFTPATPFEIDDGREWKDYDAADIAAGVRTGRLSGTLTFAVPGKIRPVLAISEPSETTDEITGLRLTNLTARVRAGRLANDDLRAIRRQGLPNLFHLRPKTVKRLGRSTGDEYAAITDALVRLHRSAVTTAPVGEVNPAEFQALCQRLVADLGLDVSALITARVAELDRRTRG